jgi:hypothetical protein
MIAVFVTAGSSVATIIHANVYPRMQTSVMIVQMMNAVLKYFRHTQYMILATIHGSMFVNILAKILSCVTMVVKYVRARILIMMPVTVLPHVKARATLGATSIHVKNVVGMPGLIVVVGRIIHNAQVGFQNVTVNMLHVEIGVSMINVMKISSARLIIYVPRATDVAYSTMIVLIGVGMMTVGLVYDTPTY